MEKNRFFQELLINCDIQIFLDTNFFIAPKSIDKEQFRMYWINGLTSIFKNMCMHESVYNELVSDDLKRARKDITVYFNSNLTKRERVKFAHAFDVLEDLLDLGYTKCNKNLGEVATLSYMFAIESDSLSTLDKDVIRKILDPEMIVLFSKGLGVIHFYEFIYYLKKRTNTPHKFLKALYKAFYPVGILNYHTGTREDIGDFNEFIKLMDLLYEVDNNPTKPVVKSMCLDL